MAKDPGPGLFPDTRGPREPGFIPVWQLNFAPGRNVPCATIPFGRMKSPGDKLLDAPPFQQQVSFQTARSNVNQLAPAE